MKYLFEKLEQDISLLDSISNQIAFSLLDLSTKKLDLKELKEILQQEEGRVDITEIEKDKKLIISFYSEELQDEFRRLF